MNKKIKQVFNKFLTAHITIKEFEQWLYDNEELEHIIDFDDYTNLISLNFDDKFAFNDVGKIISKYICIDEYEKYKLISLLHEILANDETSICAIEETYYLYCNGYEFLQDIGLNYGLDIAVIDCATQSIEDMYPSIIVEVQKILDLLHKNKIVFRDELNDYNLCEYDDFR